MRRRLPAVLALAAASALALSACAPVEESATVAEPTPVLSAGALPTLTDGVLTIATSEPAYEPWMVDDDPTNQEGYESAVAYAVAAELGYEPAQVEWVRATFEQIIAPGAKDFDLAINQVSITDERKANLDFSSSYYDTTQAVVTLEGTPAADATSIADLEDLRIGAMVGTTSAQVAADAIAPTADVQQYNDNNQLTQALTAGLVDAIVLDLPTALYVSGVQLDGGVLVGQLPTGDAPDQFGIVLDKDSILTGPVTEAVDALREDGTLAELEKTWITDAAGAPVLS